jgi:hypothetical protein
MLFTLENSEHFIFGAFFGLYDQFLENDDYLTVLKTFFLRLVPHHQQQSRGTKQ